MTYDEAVSKARNEANRQRRAIIVFSQPSSKGGLKYGLCPASWSISGELKGLIAICRVDPTFRHWNGSRLVETQAVVPYVTDPDLGLVKAQQREYQV